MKLGLFGARADERGLGRLTQDFYRHLRPDRVAVIDMGPWARGFPQHLGRYPGATIVPFGGGLIDEDVMRRWFAGLDVAVMFETPYDPRAFDVARSVGCRTVLYAMPEFWRAEYTPDVTWTPTTWRLEHLPETTRVVPAPVDPARPYEPSAAHTGPLRVVHVAGHRAHGDRNGTTVVLQALRLVTERVDVRIATQDRRLPATRGVGRNVRVATLLGGVDDHWALYDNADVLLLPRRYGGLSLVANEACAAGLALVMTDCSPNLETWPIIPIRSQPGPTINCPGGEVIMADPDPADLARIIDRLATDPAEVAAAKEVSRVWAQRNSWAALEPIYRGELERADGEPRG